MEIIVKAIFIMIIIIMLIQIIFNIKEAIKIHKETKKIREQIKELDRQIETTEGDVYRLKKEIDELRKEEHEREGLDAYNIGRKIKKKIRELKELENTVLTCDEIQELTPEEYKRKTIDVQIKELVKEDKNENKSKRLNFVKGCAE